jgi:hypothetical protein
MGERWERDGREMGERWERARTLKAHHRAETRGQRSRNLKLKAPPDRDSDPSPSPRPSPRRHSGRAPHCSIIRQSLKAGEDRAGAAGVIKALRAYDYA